MSGWRRRKPLALLPLVLGGFLFGQSLTLTGSFSVVERERLEDLLEQHWPVLQGGIASVAAPPPFHICRDLAEFSARTGAPSWQGGHYRHGRITLQRLAALEERGILEETVRHELVHHLVRERGGPDVPRWLAEGLATWLGRSDPPGPAAAGKPGTPAVEPAAGGKPGTGGTETDAGRKPGTTATKPDAAAKPGTPATGPVDGCKPGTPDPEPIHGRKPGTPPAVISPAAPASVNSPPPARGAITSSPETASGTPVMPRPGWQTELDRSLRSPRPDVQAAAYEEAARRAGILLRQYGWLTICRALQAWHRGDRQVLTAMFSEISPGM